jgi:FkbM family methyltransferase
MGVKTFAKRVIRNIFESRGYFVINAADHIGSTMAGALQAISARGHLLNTVVDIGASNGQWSSLFMEYYPACNYLLVEAQPFHEKELKRFCHEHRNADYVLAAAGENEGRINFNTNDPFGGRASSTPFASNNITVPMVTIDGMTEQKGLDGPYLLKLDVHGYEVPIFKGAEKVLKETEIIVVECYNFKIAPECLLFHEMCSFLAGKGFRCIDMVDVMHRPYDRALWQMDLIFAKNDRAEFHYNSYA